jgi:exopolyphosphatase/pppGpp-phosphohydrolase
MTNLPANILPRPDTSKNWLSEHWLSGGLTPEQIDQLQAVLELVHVCNLPPEHTHQVTCLALRLFDALQPVHQLDTQARFRLACAALLHDVGKIEGVKNHHKNSLRIILTTPLLTFDSKERLVVGSIARYHRKALPSTDQDHFKALDPASRKLVSKLAAILRLATGLDASYHSLVSDLTCQVTKKRITIFCTVSDNFDHDHASATEHSDLMADVFDRKISIKAQNPRNKKTLAKTRPAS